MVLEWQTYGKPTKKRAAAVSGCFHPQQAYCQWKEEGPSEQQFLAGMCSLAHSLVGSWGEVPNHQNREKAGNLVPHQELGAPQSRKNRHTRGKENKRMEHSMIFHVFCSLVWDKTERFYCILETMFLWAQDIQHENRLLARCGCL